MRKDASTDDSEYKVQQLYWPHYSSTKRVVKFQRFQVDREKMRCQLLEVVELHFMIRTIVSQAFESLKNT